METILYDGMLCEVLSDSHVDSIIIQGQKSNGDGFQKKFTKKQFEDYKQGIIEKDKTEKIWELKYSRGRTILKTGSWILCQTERDKIKGLTQYQIGKLNITLKL